MDKDGETLRAAWLSPTRLRGMMIVKGRRLWWMWWRGFRVLSWCAVFSLLAYASLHFLWVKMHFERLPESLGALIQSGVYLAVFVFLLPLCLGFFICSGRIVADYNPLAEETRDSDVSGIQPQNQCKTGN